MLGQSGKVLAREKRKVSARQQQQLTSWFCVSVCERARKTTSPGMQQLKEGPDPKTQDTSHSPFRGWLKLCWLELARRDDALLKKFEVQARSKTCSLQNYIFIIIIITQDFFKK